MSSVHWPHPMIVGVHRDSRISGPSRCESCQRNDSADRRDQVEYVVVSGRARVLLEHIAEAEIAGPGKRSGEHRPPDQCRCLSLADSGFKFGHVSQESRGSVNDEIHQHRRDHHEVPIIRIDGDISEPRAFHFPGEGNSQYRHGLNELGDQVPGM